MHFFLIIVAAVVFISSCFFKKKLWENRYLVLTIISGVALVAITVNNFTSRKNLDTHLTSNTRTQVIPMTINSNLIDSSNISTSSLGRYSILHDSEEDTTCTTKVSSFFIFKSEGDFRVAFNLNGKSRLKHFDVDNVYIQPSNSDTVSFYTKLTLRYDNGDSKWTNKLSQPKIKTIKVLYLPPTDYELLPDSLINELPFNIDSYEI